jgi:hypothetical protein
MPLNVIFHAAVAGNCGNKFDVLAYLARDRRDAGLRIDAVANLNQAAFRASEINKGLARHAATCASAASTAGKRHAGMLSFRFHVSTVVIGTPSLRAALADPPKAAIF